MIFYVCVHMCVQAHQIPQELEFCAVVSLTVWVLGTKLKPSASAAKPTPQLHLFLKDRLLEAF